MKNTDAEILKWENDIANSSDESRGKLSADFAQRLWNGVFDNGQQIRLLKAESAAVRRSVAWAISDQAKTGEALDFLIENCINDPDPSVRQSSVMGVRNGNHLATVDKRKRFLKIVEGHTDADVKLLAQRILDDIEEQGLLSWTKIVKRDEGKSKGTQPRLAKGDGAQ